MRASLVHRQKAESPALAGLSCRSGRQIQSTANSGTPTAISRRSSGRSNYLLDQSGGTILAASDPQLRYPDLSLSYLGSTYPSSRPASTADVVDEASSSTSYYAEDATRMHNLPGYGNRVTGHVRSYPDGTKVLQYWFFYYYNPKTYFTRGAHEGDWEMVQVKLGSDLLPESATYAQHEGGERCDWIHVLKTPAGRPVVYVAEGSHASYFSPGYYFNGGANDSADANGFEVSPTLMTGTSSWLAWPGHWGGTPNATFGTDSPQGPAFHGVQWSDPEQWSQSVDGCTEAQVSSAARQESRVRAVRAKPSRYAPPPPTLSARVVRGRFVIHYRLQRASGRSTATNLLTSVTRHRKSEPPETIRTKIRSTRGVVVRKALANDSVLRVAVEDAQGRRSRIVTLLSR